MVESEAPANTTNEPVLALRSAYVLGAISLASNTSLEAIAISFSFNAGANTLFIYNPFRVRYKGLYLPYNGLFGVVHINFSLF